MSNYRDTQTSSPTATPPRRQYTDTTRTPQSQRSYNTPTPQNRSTSPALSSNPSVMSGFTALSAQSNGQKSTPAGIPTRLAAAALRELNRTTSPSPGPAQRRVIYIEDSDEDEDGLTSGTESSVEVTPLRPTPLSADSSLSSMNSMFSRLSSRSSSQSSIDIESPSRAAFPKQRPVTPISKPPTGNKGTPESSRRTGVPKCISDIFSNTPPTTPSRGSSSAGAVQLNGPKSVANTPAAQASQKELSAFDVVSNFARSPFGTNLACAVIAHDTESQRLFDEHRIEWGVQYELARGVTMNLWTWDKVRPHIATFTGNNEAMAGKVRSRMNEIMANQPPGRASAEHVGLWRELDREQAAIAENIGRGLGLMGEWKEKPDWYGGRIQQIARLVKDGSKLKIVLEPMENKRSQRFARFYGSRRFIQVAVPSDLLQTEYENVKKFLAQKFLLCGRVYVPFVSKERRCYMVETNENVDRSEQLWCSDDLRMSFRDFINWHNPLTEEKNYNQVISKYVTRFALGLSTSIPVLEFQEENIIFIDDLTSSLWPAGKKNAPAEMLMTDGCGFLNHAALLAMVNYLKYESLPAGVQGRLDGSKGFWILHPTDQSEVPKIWIRDSQNKIKNSGFDRAHRIFDLLGPSRPYGTASLTSQSIMNVFANDIPADVLAKMMEDGLEKEIGPLLDWNRPNAMVFLWDAISKLGSVSGTRAQRVSAAMNRAMGLRGRDWGDEDVSQNINEGMDDPPVYTGRNEYSGAPAALHESAVELIQAGFHPKTCQQLNQKLLSIIKVAISASVAKYRIPVEESVQAYVVPDPLNVLKEGEIYFRFSKPRRDPKTALLLHALEGDVLLGRYPIRLPSDIQKVRAVNVKGLEKWPDVVIVSTQGKRSIASLLADGDMDGDELFVTWDQILVNAFSNKEFTKPPDGFLEKDFTRDVEKVEQFCRRVGSLPEREAHEAFQKVIVANLTDSKVGLYSSMHEKAVVKHGYHNEKTVRLAYIFATLLDSSKSGHRLKPDVFEDDKKRYMNVQVPDKADNDILRILKDAAIAKGEDLMKGYPNLKVEGQFDRDEDLLRPYRTYADFCLKAADNKAISVFQDELELIRNHVDAAFTIWKSDVNKSGSEASSLQSPTKKNKKKIDPSKAASFAYSQPIEGITLTSNVEELKASYACTDRRSYAFAFTVAFEELCRIKARASPGGHAPNLRIFDEAKSLSSSFLRALNSLDDD